MLTNRAVVRQVSVIIGLIVTLVINTLSVTLPLNGRDTREISDSFPIAFVPDAYVFGIWGPIYLGVIAYAIYQALPSKRYDPVLSRIGWPFVFSCIGNALWIVLWHYGFYALTLLFMVELLIFLVIIYLAIAPYYDRAPLIDRLIIHWPFSMYTAWVTVATIVNTVVVLYDLGWRGWGISDSIWSILLLIVTTLLAGKIVYERADLAFAGVIVWACVGIGVKQATLPAVVVAANSAATVVAAIAIWSFVRNLRPSSATIGTYGQE